MSDQQQKPDRSAWEAFRRTWVTPDNVMLFAGLVLVSVGAALWSVRAGLLTCGCVILGFMAFNSVLDRIGGKR